MKDQVPPVPATYAPPPVAAPVTGSIYAASLSGRRSLLPAEDRKARYVGDILTILLVERLQAEKSTSQDASRDAQRSLDLPDAQPFSSIPEGLFSGGTSSSFKGTGSTRQANRLSGEITVTVVQVLPNGALMVAGDRRITLTRGEEQAQITGIVRPEDISPENRVLSTRVADARLRYSGTGEIAAQSRQGWLSRFFDRITPF
ncbi:flagellar basal body L-ring protein FlgH [Sandaracinobacteroides hominis]|uniref:flagellar basal body L-ring protein FlgH n=1 Tax=Sandaracinobacteroides hominis TaxID=2780086 RepID=UPI0018F6777D|nr:flagellar basal body L-ring protein FlgH [Sandaracinobacteroides hominis]